MASSVSSRSFAEKDKERKPTSGLEPLSCSLRVIHQTLHGFAQPCKSAYLGWFPFTGLLCVAPYCAPGGVRVVSKSPSYPPSTRLLQTGSTNGLARKSTARAPWANGPRKGANLPGRLRNARLAEVTRPPAPVGRPHPSLLIPR
jgi:hypothetical protein